MSSHEEVIERDWKTPYVLGELQERERNRFEEHLFDCPACLESVNTAYLLLRGVETTLKHPVFGAEVEREPVTLPAGRKIARPALSWAMAALPYAAILCLSVAAGAQYFALQKARSPQAVVAFAIHTQAKGGASEVVLPTGGGFVELELDIPEMAPQYNWEIKAAGADRALMSGQAQPPDNTVVIKLLVPAEKLHPGLYEADIMAPPGRKAVYPFNVRAEPERKSAR